jgi:hypothetical protein
MCPDGYREVNGLLESLSLVSPFTIHYSLFTIDIIIQPVVILPGWQLQP